MLDSCNRLVQENDKVYTHKNKKQVDALRHCLLVNCSSPASEMNLVLGPGPNVWMFVSLIDFETPSWNSPATQRNTKEESHSRTEFQTMRRSSKLRPTARLTSAEHWQVARGPTQAHIKPRLNFPKRGRSQTRKGLRSSRKVHP